MGCWTRRATFVLAACAILAGPGRAYAQRRGGGGGFGLRGGFGGPGMGPSPGGLMPYSGMGGMAQPLSSNLMMQGGPWSGGMMTSGRGRRQGWRQSDDDDQPQGPVPTYGGQNQFLVR